MILIDKKSSVKIFFYLMAVDDNIEKEEIDALNSIGDEIDPSEFSSYRDSLFGECVNAVRVADENFLYDILSEHVDDALQNTVESLDQGIPSRMLIWDMLVISMADHEYEDIEKRLILHVVRKCNLDQSVFLEMEQLIKSSDTIDKELDSFSNSNLPYNEVKPIVDEAKKRKKNITECVTELISDELIAPIKVAEVKEDFIDKAKANPFFQKASEKTTEFFTSTKKQFGTFFGSIKNKFKKTSDSGEEDK